MSASGPFSSISVSFAQTRDAVSDLGMDNTGGSSVVSAVEGAPDDTLIEFPDGTYLFGSEAILGQSHLGFLGTGDNVTFTVPDSYNDRFLNTANGHGRFRFENIDIDQTAADTLTGMRCPASKALIKNVEFVGRGNDSAGADGVDMLTPACNTPGNRYRIENVVSTQNRWDNYTGGARIGIFVGDRHDGIMEVLNCDLREFPNNAMYASRTTGDVRVFDTYFENNNAASCRIGGNGSWIRSCEFVVDPALYNGPSQGGDQQMTMVVIEENFAVQGFEKPAGAYVEDSTFRYEDVTGDPGSAVEVYQNGRSLRMTNCEIEYNNNAGAAAIERLEYDTRGSNNNPPGSEPRDLTLEGVTIKTAGSCDEVVLIIDGDGSSIEQSTCIESTANAPNGVVTQDTRNDGETMAVSITDTNINVGGTTVVENTCNVTQTNVTTTGSCTLDGVGGGSLPGFNRGAYVEGRGTVVDGRGKQT